MDIREQIAELRRNQGYGGSEKAADTMESLLARNELLEKVLEIADGIQALHKGKAGGLGQWTELREAIAACAQTRLPSDQFAEAIDKLCKLEEDSAPERHDPEVSK